MVIKMDLFFFISELKKNPILDDNLNQIEIKKKKTRNLLYMINQK